MRQVRNDIRNLARDMAQLGGVGRNMGGADKTLAAAMKYQTAVMQRQSQLQNTILKESLKQQGETRRALNSQFLKAQKDALKAENETRKAAAREAAMIEKERARAIGDIIKAETQEAIGSLEARFAQESKARREATADTVNQIRELSNQEIRAIQDSTNQNIAAIQAGNSAILTSTQGGMQAQTRALLDGITDQARIRQQAILDDLNHTHRGLAERIAAAKTASRELANIERQANQERLAEIRHFVEQEKGELKRLTDARLQESQRRHAQELAREKSNVDARVQMLKGLQAQEEATRKAKLDRDIAALRAHDAALGQIESAGHAARIARMKQRHDLDLANIRTSYADQILETQNAHETMRATATRALDQQVADMRAGYNEMAAAHDEAGRRMIAQTTQHSQEQLRVMQREMDQRVAMSRDASREWEQVSESLFMAGAAATAAFTVPITLAARSVITAGSSFESAFAQVRKTNFDSAMSAAENEVAFAALRETMIDMTRVLPITREELAGVVTMAGQLGVAREDAAAFAETIIRMAESSNLSLEEAADGMARLANVFNMPMSDISRLGSTIAGLGIDMAATESDILRMSFRIAGAGKQAGLTNAEVVGLAASISSLGIRAEMGGSAISRVLQDITKWAALGGEELQAVAEVAGMTAEQFATAWEERPQEAFLAFLEGFARVGEEGAAALQFLDDVALDGIRVSDLLLRMGGNTELIAKGLAMANPLWEENSALLQISNERFQTLEARWQIAKNEISAVALVVYDRLRPALVSIVESIASFGQALAELVASAMNLPTPILAVAAAILAVLAALGPVLIGLAGFAAAMAGINAIANVLGVGALAVAIGLGKILIVIAALIVVVILVIRYWDELNAMFPNTIKAITVIASLIGESLITVLKFIGPILLDITEGFAEMVVAVLMGIDWIIGKVIELIGWYEKLGTSGKVAGLAILAMLGPAGIVAAGALVAIEVLQRLNDDGFNPDVPAEYAKSVKAATDNLRAAQGIDPSIFGFMDGGSQDALNHLHFMNEALQNQLMTTETLSSKQSEYLRIMSSSIATEKDFVDALKEELSTRNLLNANADEYASIIMDATIAVERDVIARRAQIELAYRGRDAQQDLANAAQRYNDILSTQAELVQTQGRDAQMDREAAAMNALAETASKVSEQIRADLEAAFKIGTLEQLPELVDLALQAIANDTIALADALVLLRSTGIATADMLTTLRDKKNELMLQRLGANLAGDAEEAQRLTSDINTLNQTIVALHGNIFKLAHAIPRRPGGRSDLEEMFKSASLENVSELIGAATQAISAHVITARQGADLLRRSGLPLVAVMEALKEQRAELIKQRFAAAMAGDAAAVAALTSQIAIIDDQLRRAAESASLYTKNIANAHTVHAAFDTVKSGLNQQQQYWENLKTEAEDGLEILERFKEEQGGILTPEQQQQWEKLTWLVGRSAGAISEDLEPAMVSITAAHSDWIKALDELNSQRAEIGDEEYNRRLVELAKNFNGALDPAGNLTTGITLLTDAINNLVRAIQGLPTENPLPPEINTEVNLKTADFDKNMTVTRDEAMDFASQTWITSVGANIQPSVEGYNEATRLWQEYSNSNPMTTASVDKRNAVADFIIMQGHVQDFRDANPETTAMLNNIPFMEGIGNVFTKIDEYIASEPTTTLHLVDGATQIIDTVAGRLAILTGQTWTVHIQGITEFGPGELGSTPAPSNGGGGGGIPDTGPFAQNARNLQQAAAGLSGFTLKPIVDQKALSSARTQLNNAHDFVGFIRETINLLDTAAAEMGDGVQRARDFAEAAKATFEALNAAWELIDLMGDRTLVFAENHHATIEALNHLLYRIVQLMAQNAESIHGDYLASAKAFAEAAGAAVTVFTAGLELLDSLGDRAMRLTVDHHATLEAVNHLLYKIVQLMAQNAESLYGAGLESAKKLAESTAIIVDTMNNVLDLMERLDDRTYLTNERLNRVDANLRLLAVLAFLAAQHFQDAAHNFAPDQGAEDLAAAAEAAVATMVAILDLMERLERTSLSTTALSDRIVTHVGRLAMHARNMAAIFAASAAGFEDVNVDGVEPLKTNTELTLAAITATLDVLDLLADRSTRAELDTTLIARLARSIAERARIIATEYAAVAAGFEEVNTDGVGPLRTVVEAAVAALSETLTLLDAMANSSDALSVSPERVAANARNLAEKARMIANAFRLVSADWGRDVDPSIQAFSEDVQSSTGALVAVLDFLKALSEGPVRALHIDPEKIRERIEKLRDYAAGIAMAFKDIEWSGTVDPEIEAFAGDVANSTSILTNAIDLIERLIEFGQPNDRENDTPRKAVDLQKQIERVLGDLDMILIQVRDAAASWQESLVDVQSFGQAVDAVFAALEQAMSLSGQGEDADLSGIQNVIAEIIELFNSELFGELLALIQEKLPQMREGGFWIGSSIGHGVVAGLESTRALIMATVESIASEIEARFATAMKSESPSRVMMQRGAEVGTGLVVGMLAALPQIRQAVQDIANEIKAVSFREVAPAIVNEATGLLQMRGFHREIASRRTVYARKEPAQRIMTPAETRRMDYGRTAVREIADERERGGGDVSVTVEAYNRRVERVQVNRNNRRLRTRY